MKRYFYLILMAFCFVVVFNFFYFISIYSVVYYHIVPIRSVLDFTDITLAPWMFALVSGIAILVSLPVGKKWWKIIYVD